MLTRKFEQCRDEPRSCGGKCRPEIFPSAVTLNEIVGDVSEITGGNMSEGMSCNETYAKKKLRGATYKIGLVLARARMRDGHQ
jgi:hypothetical protein